MVLFFGWMYGGFWEWYEVFFVVGFEGDFRVWCGALFNGLVCGDLGGFFAWVGGCSFRLGIF